MSMKHAFFRILLLLIILPPPVAHPASSDSFPWSNTPNNNPADLSTGVRRDAYGALRDANMLPDNMPATVPLNQNKQADSNMETGLIAPGGTVSGSGIAQGNVGPTQSGPGAVGLFTPNSPGNAAAFKAQMNGGLAGSPIVDGNGANIHVTVPVATPSVVPSYEQFSNGRSDNLTTFSSNNRAPGTPMTAPTPLTTRRAPISSQSALNMQVDRNAIPVRMVKLSAPNAVSSRRMTRTYRAPLVMRTKSLPVRHQTTSDAVKTIGEVTGSITYADGQKTIFGTQGNASVNARKATVSLPHGKVIPLGIAGPELNKVAQKSQVPL